MDSNRVLHGLHVSPVTHLETEKRSRETEHGPCFARSYKSIFLGKTMKFCQVVPGQRADLHSPASSLPPEGPSLVFPKKVWHTQGDHHGCLCRHTLSGTRLLSARQTQKAGNYISVFERLSRLTSPEMSFLDVSATQGS